MQRFKAEIIDFSWTNVCVLNLFFTDIVIIAKSEMNFSTHSVYVYSLY